MVNLKNEIDEYEAIKLSGYKDIAFNYIIDVYIEFYPSITETEQHDFEKFIENEIKNSLTTEYIVIDLLKKIPNQFFREKVINILRENRSDDPYLIFLLGECYLLTCPEKAFEIILESLKMLIMYETDLSVMFAVLNDFKELMSTHNAGSLKSKILDSLKNLNFENETAEIFESVENYILGNIESRRFEEQLSNCVQFNELAVISDSIPEYSSHYIPIEESRGLVLKSPEAAAKFIHSKLDLSYKEVCIDKKAEAERIIKTMSLPWEQANVRLERIEEDYEYYDEYDYEYEFHIDITLDEDFRVRNTNKHTCNNKHSVLYNRKEMIEQAKVDKAKYVIVSHCHPGNVTEPSEADKTSLKHLNRLLRAYGIILLDDIIVTASGNYYSFREKGLI